MTKTAGLLLAAAAMCSAAVPVRSYEGTVTIPTYQHSARETQPPLFGNSAIAGAYPFPVYLLPFQPDGPKPRSYHAIFVENEYLKLTYLPDFGGRVFSLYDKVRGREVYYRNDVIKPAGYNAKNGFPLFGIELTGAWDTHMLTLYGEPHWANKIVPREDGSISLVLGQLDPMYHMKVSLSFTLHPGIAAMEVSVLCYNRRDGRMPQMFWLSGALPATPKTRFIYPMTRTIGHTTSEIADWPVWKGIDYSWDRNNRNMLGVFGIDIYDNFEGAYRFDEDYGVFRYGDRRIVQGMKMWTFGYSPTASAHERGYTDQAGPYVEVQSGRYVWDGHYEWVGPHKVEEWSEWWVPVAGIGGLTTLTRDLALNLDAGARLKIGLSAVRAIPGAKVAIAAQSGEIWKTTVDLAPGRPFNQTIDRAPAELRQVTVTVTDAGGRELLRYRRPDSDPGRKEYTPFTRPLENPPKAPEQMSAEELVLAAEFKLKELNAPAATDLLNKALARDPGFSRAHLLLGIHHFNAGRPRQAAEHLEKAIERDPYFYEAYYYLALSQLALGEEQRGERNLYYIQPLSGFFGERECQLGKLAFVRRDDDGAAAHLERAILANGYDLGARLLLALTLRRQSRTDEALEQLAAIERIDPTNRPAAAERYFLTGAAAARAELMRMMGGQSQDAIDVSLFYRGVRQWKEAVEVLRLAEQDNRDVWGTPPEFYYTLAYCLQQNGEPDAAADHRKKARAAAGHVDRFPERLESEAPLADAVEADSRDAVAQFNLACLLYYRERPAEAIRHWEAAVAADPEDFSSRRALGLAYAEQGYPVEKAAAQLAKAVDLNPGHLPTLTDLSALYSRAGRFDDQLAVLTRAFARAPGEDNLAEAVFTAYLVRGRYDEAEKLIASHTFAPRHRTYGLRDKYRCMRYAAGAAAFHRGDAAEAVKQFESALHPPVSLGADDFQSGSTPRGEYYLGRAYEAAGKKTEAVQAYTSAVRGLEHLSGDRDSWNSENFYVVLALEKLGREQEARQLVPRFEHFAQAEMDSKSALHQAEARYLLALVRKHAGDAGGARKLLEEALAIRPDFLAPRLELRGEALD